MKQYQKFKILKYLEWIGLFHFGTNGFIHIAMNQQYYSIELLVVIGAWFARALASDLHRVDDM